MRQKGADGPTTGTGHLFARANEPFGPVVRSLREVNAEAQAYKAQRAQQQQRLRTNLSAYPDLATQVTSRSPTTRLEALSREADNRSALGAQTACDLARAREYQAYLADNSYDD